MDLYLKLKIQLIQVFILVIVVLNIVVNRILFIIHFYFFRFIRKGYLDFSIDNSLLNGDNIIGFQYGAAGYSVAKLFRLNQELIEKYNIKSA